MESPGPINRDALQFLSELGSWRLVETTGDVRAFSILFQRISVVVQRFNSVLLHDGLLMKTDQGRFTTLHVAESRRYRRSLSADNRRLWVDAVRQRLQLYRVEKEAYWLNRLEQNGRSPPQLWRSLSTVLGRDRDVTGATGHTADGFAKYFAQKIDDVRTATANHASPSVIQTANSTLSTFRPCTQADVRRIIIASPMKSCSLDPVPTFVIREAVDVLLSYITCMVNASLCQETVPALQKHAIITPLIKKQGLGVTDIANFRPVSNLTFISKVIERAAAEQLNEYLNAEDLLPRNQ